MYLVNKGFANSYITASKGKVIDIKDKSLAKALESAGFISTYSEKVMSNKEMEKTIKDLTKQLDDKDSEIQTLKDKVTELEEELKVKAEENSDEEKENNLDNGEEPSKEDNGNGEIPDANNGEEPQNDKE